MDLSIIIPSFNTKTLLDRCLSSIRETLRGSQISYEIIIVDNASTDGTMELLNKKYPRVKKIFNNENTGYGKANNQAIREAKGTYVLLLNSDTKVMPDGIQNLLGCVKAHSRSFVGGKLYNEDGTPQASCGPDYVLPVIFAMLFLKGDSLCITRYSPRSQRSVAWVSGACLMGAKADFVDVGLFDEGIFMYMEEIDFLYRARQKGYTVLFCPSAQFIHTGAASSGTKKTPVINIFRGLRYYYRKHRSIIEQWLLEVLLLMKAHIAIGAGKVFGNNGLVDIYEQALQSDQ